MKSSSVKKTTKVSTSSIDSPKPPKINKNVKKFLALSKEHYFGSQKELKGRAVDFGIVVGPGVDLRHTSSSKNLGQSSLTSSCVALADRRANLWHIGPFPANFQLFLHATY
ncbi:hypothetical protein HAX54_007650 [Datura stramonium]|uniref:Uncharacterized protein n=1 Tax=Datura stramonium TaxID=4076 RepID=A0ABS8WYF6_DATST|nr:hypothetical protein [Datura stramonium]